METPGQLSAEINNAKERRKQVARGLKIKLDRGSGLLFRERLG